MATLFSIKLKELRKSRGLKQCDVAERMDFSASYLSTLESGNKPPPEDNEFYKKLKTAISLTEEELKELRELAERTRLYGPIVQGKTPQGATPLQVEVATMFAERLRWLKPAHIRAINAVLELVDPAKGSSKLSEQEPAKFKLS